MFVHGVQKKKKNLGQKSVHVNVHRRQGVCARSRVFTKQAVCSQQTSCVCDTLLCSFLSFSGLGTFYVFSQQGLKDLPFGTSFSDSSRSHLFVKRVPQVPSPFLFCIPFSVFPSYCEPNPKIEGKQKRRYRAGNDRENNHERDA